MTQSSYLQPGASDSDDYFDLPDAGEDSDYDQEFLNALPVLAEDYCRRCGAMLTEADYEGERCSQCGFRLRGKEQ